MMQVRAPMAQPLTSESTYGTASYIVLVDDQGKTSCSLMMAKSRVAPLTQITIPRLELTAAVVAVKVDKMLQDEMQDPLQQSFLNRQYNSSVIH